MRNRCSKFSYSLRYIVSMITINTSGQSECLDVTRSNSAIQLFFTFFS